MAISRRSRPRFVRPMSLGRRRFADARRRRLGGCKYKLMLRTTMDGRRKCLADCCRSASLPEIFYRRHDRMVASIDTAACGVVRDGCRRFCVCVRQDVK